MFFSVHSVGPHSFRVSNNNFDNKIYDLFWYFIVFVLYLFFYTNNKQLKVPTMLNAEAKSPFVGLYVRDRNGMYK
jgi:hypothetical protein